MVGALPVRVRGQTELRNAIRLGKSSNISAMKNCLTIVQSSPSQSALPVFRELMSSPKGRIILFSFFYPPDLFTSKQNNLTVFDWTDRIAGYSGEPLDLMENIPTGKPCAA